MKLVNFALGAVMIVAPITLAAAQTTGSTTRPSPGELAALIQSGTHQGSGHIGGATSAISTGWNLAHCYTAQWYSDGTNNYIFGFNIDGSYIYEANNTILGETILNVCTSGQLYGYYVYNSSGQYSVIQQKW